MTHHLKQSSFVLIAAALLLGGCASTPLDDARSAFLRGEPAVAMATLDNPDNHSRRNALLFNMEKGLILHHLGEYERSATEFRKAAQLKESQDYISVSEQAQTLIGNQWLARYKGEYSERLWIHTYQMMNYLLLGEPEGAAVEARQALQVLDKYPEALEKDWFTHALIGLSFERVGQINAAHIEYKKLAEKMPDNRAIAAQLYWNARRLGLTKDIEKYKASIPEHLQQIDPDPYRELVVFVAHGAIPQKTSGNIFIAPDIRVSFPHYLPSLSQPPSLKVKNDRGQALPFVSVSTDLGKVAATALQARGKSIFAKEATRLAVKQSLVHNLKDSDEAAAQVLSLLFLVLEEADTRSWGTLPESLVMLRIPLASETHRIIISLPESPTEAHEIDNLSLESGPQVIRKIRF